MLVSVVLAAIVAAVYVGFIDAQSKMHRIEIETIKSRIIPLMKHYVETQQGGKLGNDAKMAPDSFREMVLGDRTARFIYENITTSRREYGMAAFSTVTPGGIDRDCTQTDWTLVDDRLFVFGHDGAGGTFVLNLVDRNVYYLDVSWGDDGWLGGQLKRWESFDLFADYVESQIREQWNQEPVEFGAEAGE